MQIALDLLDTREPMKMESLKLDRRSICGSAATLVSLALLLGDASSQTAPAVTTIQLNPAPTEPPVRHMLDRLAVLTDGTLRWCGDDREIGPMARQAVQRFWDHYPDLTAALGDTVEWEPARQRLRQSADDSAVPQGDGRRNWCGHMVLALRQAVQQTQGHADMRELIQRIQAQAASEKPAR